MDTDGHILKQITDQDSEEWAPVWINDLEVSYLSQVGEKISIIRHNLQSGQKSVIRKPGNCLIDDKNIMYSPSGYQKLYSCKGEIYLIDHVLQTNENITANIEGTANYASWGNENEVFFTSNHEGNI